MYCKKCGNMQKNGEKFCPKCGTPYLSENSKELSDLRKNPVDNDSGFESNQNSEESPRQEFTNNRPTLGEKEMSKVDDNSPEDTSSTKNKISISKIILIALLVVFGVRYCGSFNDSDSGSVEYEQSAEYEQSSEKSYEESSVSFSSEQDVRTYLCTHSFTSSDGYTLTFSSNAYEVSLNGRILSSATDVYMSSSNTATIRTHGPYGNTTFRLSVSGGDGVIRDSNDGESYYSK